MIILRITLRDNQGKQYNSKQVNIEEFLSIQKQKSIV
jgi:hypothetical protein